MGFAVVFAEPEAGGTAAAVTLPAPADVRFYGLGGGRFEVVTDPGDDGQRLARLAEEGWESWRGPLGLPERFPVGITVRLAPEAVWSFPGPLWHVASGPGGVVSVWIRAGGVADTDRDRIWLMAMAEGALHRQAVFLGASPERLAPPSWVVAAAAEATLVRTNPALRTIFEWSGAQDRSLADPCRPASFGAWQWLLAESGRSMAWRRFLASLLTGTAPGAALVGAYGDALGRQQAPEIELAWQVGAAAQARIRATPFLDAEESRRRLEEATSLVVADAGNGAESLVRLGEIWDARDDEFIAARREERLRWLDGHFTRLHPFYRNASGSLGRVFLAQRQGDAGAWSEALEDWRRDFAAGRELEDASRRLLD